MPVVACGVPFNSFSFSLSFSPARLSIRLRCNLLFGAFVRTNFGVEQSQGAWIL
jgi:hypothetical protein